ncbi:hypothetical protein AB3N02_13940 [Priestia aryabhattai]|uniref:hypothetical protein n=1 Tax=Priestia aryabhattai TaxID=412384 RepID=UPI0039A14E1D
MNGSGTVCRRCSKVSASHLKFCIGCGYRFNTIDQYFWPNKEFLIELALKTKDKEWFEQLNRGIITDVK